MTPLFPQIKDLVLIGGGHSHALILRMWGMNPLPGTRLTLINPDPAAPYTGMLPGLIAGHYRREELMIDLVRLARFAGARLILDRATGIDRDARLVHLAGRPPLSYDIAAIDIGITSGLPGQPDVIAAKPLGPYATAWETFLARRPARPQITILGAGLGGVELALASAHRLRGLGAKAEVTLIDRSTRFLPALSPRAQSAIRHRLAEAGITLLLGTTATEIAPGRITLSDGRTLGSDFTLSATGARPHPWLAATGLDHREGFLVTDACLRTSDPRIFASGDCASLPVPRPKAGVFAVRAAPVLHHNLVASLTSRPLRPFRPQRDYLKLVSLGERSALAEKWGLTAIGPRLWRLKDRIDRQFMDRFDAYPAMPRPAPPARQTQGLAARLDRRPLCGGCGAKLGPHVLAGALAPLPAPARAEVRSGPGDDAAVLSLPGGGFQVLTTDHLRAFCNDPRLMARIAALHAMGDVLAMGAAPQVALAQITLPPLGPELQSRMLAEIMDEAAATFRDAGADIVGGHSTEGAELTIGFTVTGTATRTIGKGGANPGDALILTKPLGSGTILAAEMALARPPGRLMGEVWAACIGQMTRAQGSAAAILTPHATAMTDVTGFGLAGHLLELLDASQSAATLRLTDIPLMPGVLELARQGHGSSLQPANLAAVSWRMTAPQDPRVDLLSDPQTAGGLLAAVPSDQAETLLAALKAAGHDAALIGTVTAGPPHLTVSA
ncbi:selenide, water dikinase SelD [Rhodobacter calidifons]|uniref:Selenide, water dikinase SelD n=1 Tax=Rhodobacter calidifons TaxID=2715277 RepID=A0ABX0G677_9RHOB|nr:selenide, water dikinase SelD [Rhodobacter calidifons]NHB76392.1 selenide, water dikinase SelD [Rhodobacter calidifons]